MPKLNEVKQFPNGKWGKFDGLGWEPTEDQTPPPATPPPSERSLGEAAVTDYGLPGLGMVLGGKVGGPIGSGVGAAAGQAYGDLYNMLQSASGHQGYGAIPTPTDEAKRLATTAGVTALGEKVLPPVLGALGSLRKILPTGGGTMGGGMLGWALGHPEVGAGVGVALDAAKPIGDGIEWLGTKAESGPLSEGMDWKGRAGQLVDGVKSAGGYVKDKGGQAIDGLKNAASSVDDSVRQWLNPVEEVPTSEFGAAREAQRAANTSGPSVRPNLSKTPSAKHAMEFVEPPGVQWHKPPNP